MSDREKPLGPSANSNMNKYNIMSTKNYKNFEEQNTKEFNKQYAELIEKKPSTEILNKPKKTEKVFDKQQVQTSNTDGASKTTTNLSTNENIEIWNPEAEEKKRQEALQRNFNGFCFMTLRSNTCCRQRCFYDHKVSIFYLLLLC